MNDTPYKSIFRKVANWKNLHFYQKSDVLYQLTVDFCERFLPKYGDRTVDQMVQAARSGKQNIVEGSEDGKTSTEMELKLLNVARASIGELREDYEDYLKSHSLVIWEPKDGRFSSMQDFTRGHNQLVDYEPYFFQWSDEEMANVAITLCHQVDVMMSTYLTALEKQFVTEGGIKERMHQSRTGYRQQQDRQLLEQTAIIKNLQQQLAASKAETLHWQNAYEDLKIRALKAYNEQATLIAELKQQLGMSH